MALRVDASARQGDTGNDERKKYLVNDLGNRFVGDRSDGDNDFVKHEAEWNAQYPPRQALRIDLGALDCSLDQFLKWVFLDLASRKFVFSFAKSSLISKMSRNC